MPKVKTAVSIEAELLEETDSIAEGLDIPRSRLVALALEDYIRRFRNKQLLHRINDAYRDGPDEDESGTIEIMRSHRRKAAGSEEWK